MEPDEMDLSRWEKIRKDEELAKRVQEWREMARQHLEQWNGMATYGLTFGQMKQMLERADALLKSW